MLKLSNQVDLKELKVFELKYYDPWSMFLAKALECGKKLNVKCKYGRKCVFMKQVNDLGLQYKMKM